MTTDEPLSIISIEITHPQGFGGHEFELTSEDLFRCVFCGGYEVVLRNPQTGEISACPKAPNAVKGTTA